MDIQLAYLVTLTDFNGENESAIFSSEKKAEEWISAKNKYALVIPYVIDMPEYGNVKNA